MSIRQHVTTPRPARPGTVLDAAASNTPAAVQHRDVACFDGIGRH